MRGDVRSRRFWGLFIAIVALACASPGIAALQADELLLIVNGNIPSSVKTAEHYAKVRNVPAGRILKLNLPSAEEVQFERYESEIVPTIRKYLRDNDLEQKVRCLVTFYGVPFRIGSMRVNKAEKEELEQLKTQLATTLDKVKPSIVQAEALAKKLNAKFAAKSGTSHSDLVQRMDAALQAIQRNLPRANDPSHRQILPELIELVTAFGGDAQLAERLTDEQAVELLPVARIANAWPARREEVENLQAQVRVLQERRYDPNARSKMREIVADTFGLFGLAGALEAQIEYLSNDGTVAAVDNELALLWWNYYSRNKWLGNPLNFRYSGPHPQTLMVMRLDGPQEGTAMQIIMASLKAEKEGLAGRIVIDSTGGTAPGGTEDKDGGYREYDQRLLKLGEMIQSKAKLPLTLDKHPKVLPPNSVHDVALYTGWYSVRNYVPAMEFKPGAVGYHIASFEMLSLHADNEKGWVAGLLGDGIAATMGAVAEPYLASFPPPDEFFPLLMTGKLTLAEVYWKTTPMTSWMITCIGDPLYTPFKANPLLKAEDLETPLRRAVEPPAGAVAPLPTSGEMPAP